MRIQVDSTFGDESLEAYQGTMTAKVDESKLKLLKSPKISTTKDNLTHYNLPKYA